MLPITLPVCLTVSLERLLTGTSTTPFEINDSAQTKGVPVCNSPFYENMIYTDDFVLVFWPVRNFSKVRVGGPYFTQDQT